MKTLQVSGTYREKFQVAPCSLMIYEITLVRINIYIDPKVDSLFKCKGSLSFQRHDDKISLNNRLEK